MFGVSFVVCASAVIGASVVVKCASFVVRARWVRASSSVLALW